MDQNKKHELAGRDEGPSVRPCSPDIESRPQIQGLLGVTELARILDLTPAAIYGLRHLGKLPLAVLVGRNLRWRVEDVERWIDDQVEPSR